MKIGLFEGFLKAFYSFKSYPRYRNQSSFKIFIYLLFLTFILSIFALFGSLGIQSEVVKMIKNNNLPKWEFQNDKLVAQSQYFLSNGAVLNGYPEETGNGFFVIDTSSDFDISIDENLILVLDPQTFNQKGYVKISENLKNFILIGQDHIVYVNSGGINEAIYSDLSSKQKDLISYENALGMLKNVGLIFYALFFLIFFITVLFGAFIQTMIALIQNNNRAENTFGQLFKMSVYARTIPTFIALLNLIIGFKIPFWFIINYIIGGVYMARAINETKKCDYIDRTKELNYLNESFDKNDYNTPFNSINGDKPSYYNQNPFNTFNDAENSEKEDF